MMYQIMPCVEKSNDEKNRIPILLNSCKDVWHLVQAATLQDQSYLAMFGLPRRV